MTQDNFKWDDNKVLHCCRDLRNKFNSPDDYENGWEGISKEIEKWKASHSSNGERDWEVLSYKTPYWGKDDVIFRKSYDGSFVAELEFPHYKYATCDELLLTEKYASIHSVLRKSDGVVFTVGDVIQVYRDSGYKGDRELLGFEIQDVVLKVVHEGSKSYIHQIQPLPKRTKLFTTEDGVDIFHDYTCIWIVNGAWVLLTKPAENCRLWIKNNRDDFKYFSTSEKAQEYITLNKPCLSVADVFGLWCINGKDRERLKELAKSKLK